MKLETGNSKLGWWGGLAAVAIAIGLCAGQAGADDFVWTDLGTDGNWANALNWTGGPGYPNGAGHTATITNSGRAIAVPAGLIVGEITIGGTYSGTNTLGGNLTVSTASGKTGNLTINAGVLRTTNDAVSGITVGGTLLIGTNGTLVVRRSSTTANGGQGAGQTINAGAMTIYGTMNASGQGFNAQQGPGAGVPHTGNPGGGGGHGGVGGFATGPYAGGNTYGSLTNPVSLGSGSGDSSAGGGAIIIDCTSGLTVEGTLAADGYSPVAGLSSGGAGGTLNIKAGILSGQGTISARGGDGHFSAASFDSGGGGGGRLDLSQVSNWAFRGTLTAAGGAKGNSALVASGGFAGTINWPTNFNLTLGNGIGEISNVVMGCDGSNNVGSEYTFASITVNNGGTLDLGGDPGLNGGSGGGPTLTAPTITVNAGGVIKATGRGLDSTLGSGGAPSYGSAGGGGYGGAGGAGASGPGGGVYGTSTNPVLLGSGGGGGASYYVTGGIGGGAYRLVAATSLTNNGTISSDGANPPLPTCYGAGGGSGGSLYIVTKLLAGNGIIRAVGGAGLAGGAAPRWGGGGGGGRILIAGYDYISQIHSFGGSIVVSGGAGSGGGSSSGQAGTVSYYLPPPPKGTVVFFR